MRTGPCRQSGAGDLVAGWSPEQIAVDLYAYAAAKRYVVETGGILFNGMSVMTDRQSQSLITGAYNYVDANPDVKVQFKTASGFVELTSTQVRSVANAVASHVQASFAAEGAVNQAIIAGMITTTAEIDAFAWPSNASGEIQ